MCLQRGSAIWAEENEGGKVRGEPSRDFAKVSGLCELKERVEGEKAPVSGPSPSPIRSCINTLSQNGFTIIIFKYEEFLFLKQ